MTKSRQIVFLHILKTAGQSIMKIMESNYSEEDRLFANQHIVVKMPPADLQNYKIIYGHNYYNIYELLGEKPIYFTFLRNPVERTLSHYAYLQRAKHPPIVLSQTVEEFVSDPETQPYVVNLQTRWLASNSLVEPARLNETGTLELAKERLREFAFVGIVEEFKKSMQVMANVFDWKLPWITPKVNVATSERLKRKELSNSAMENVINANSLDFELYEYGYELFKAKQGGNLKDIAL